MIENTTLYYALFAIAILFLAIISIFIYLVINRVYQMKREQAICQYIEEQEDAWYRYLVLGENLSYLSGSRVQEPYVKEAIDRIFVTYAMMINNTAIIERISAFARLNAHSYYQNMLYHRNWGVRMNGLDRTLDFHLDFLAPDIEKILKQKKYSSMEEYLMLLRIIAIYNESLFLAHFYKPDYPFKEFEYKSLLSRLEEHYIEHFVENFDQLPPFLRISLLDFLSFQTRVEIKYLHFYESLLDHFEPEIRVRALKVIGQFGMITSIDLYKPFVHSESWEERFMLAKLLVHADDVEARPLLEQMVLDESWWVRKQAAVSLNSVRYGAKVLLQIAEQQEDPYAAEMAKEILGVG